MVAGMIIHKCLETITIQLDEKVSLEYPMKHVHYYASTLMQALLPCVFWLMVSLKREQSWLD
jgi:hypothetical protein